jgi:hypothetical protein
VTIRTIPGGEPAVGKAYSVIREIDDVELDSDFTDANGQFEYSPDGNPGPFRWEVTDTDPEVDVTRVGSTQSSGSGGTYSLAEIPYVLRAIGPGVIDGFLNELAVTDPGTAKNLTIATGGIIAGNGIPAIWRNSATHTAASTTDASNTRACYVGIETTGVGEAAEGKAVLKDYCGAAAASPSLPSLAPLQTDTLWFEPLATFILGITGASAANSITTVMDARRYALKRNPTVVSIGYRTSLTPKTITSTSGEDVTWASGDPDTTLLSGVAYDLFADTSLQVQAPSGQTISIAISLDGNVGTYIPCSVSSTYSLIATSGYLGSVTGTGASLNHTVLAKVSSGTGNVLTGFLRVTAIPRS